MLALDFSQSSETSAWRIVNDGVMGGLSQGFISAPDGFMRFSGVINTNGGGFSSLRRWMEPGAFDGKDKVTFKLRSDGRAYALNLRTSAAIRGRSVAYRAAIPVTKPGEWAEVSVNLSDLRPTVFGRAVRAEKFDASDVRVMTIILADGKDGPFQLDIETIRME